MKRFLINVVIIAVVAFVLGYGIPMVVDSALMHWIGNPLIQTTSVVIE